MRGVWRKLAKLLGLRSADLLVAAVVLTLALAAAAGPAVARLVAGPGQVTQFVVQTATGTQSLPAGSDGTFSFLGPLGETMVEVRGGQARIASSPCAEPSWHGGWLNRPGQRSVCLPNLVSVLAEGRGAGLGGTGGRDLDGETR